LSYERVELSVLSYIETDANLKYGLATLSFLDDKPCYDKPCVGL